MPYMPRSTVVDNCFLPLRLRAKIPGTVESGWNEVPAAAKRPRGRPRKSREERKRNTIAVRARDELKSALERSAAANQRSLSEEAEMRLEQSFRAQGMLDQALELAFGRQSAAVVLLIGRLMREVGTYAALASGRMPDTAGGWLADPFAFDQVRMAINRALDAVRPDGEVVVPLRTGQTIGPDIGHADIYGHLGAGLAQVALSAIVGHGITGDLQSWGEKIRARLGPEIVDRIAEHIDEPGPPHG
jgi:hypothetical protein